MSPISSVYTVNEFTISGRANNALTNDSNVSMATMAFGNSFCIELSVCITFKLVGGPSLSPNTLHKSAEIINCTQCIHTIPICSECVIKSINHSNAVFISSAISFWMIYTNQFLATLWI